LGAFIGVGRRPTKRKKEKNCVPFIGIGRRPTKKTPLFQFAFQPDPPKGNHIRIVPPQIMNAKGYRMTVTQQNHTANVMQTASFLVIRREPHNNHVMGMIVM